MKKFILTLALALVQISTFAQAPAIQWQKALGGTSYDSARSIQPTSDGGYIIAGYSQSTDGDITGNHGNRDAWVVKLSSTGSLQWQKTLGGINDDYANSIQSTSDGGYIMAGSTQSNDGDVSGNHGSADIWVVKLSSTGNLLWQKTLGGTFSEEANSIQPTTDGGYIIAGNTSSNNGDVTGNHGSVDAWVVKINNNGSLQWQKALGGTNIDNAHNIQFNNDGSYIVVGYTNSNNGDVTGNHGNGDAWVVKISSTGSLDWQKCIGGSSDDGAESIQITTDGGYIVAGYTNSTNGDVIGNSGGQDAWVVKFSSTGSLDWQKCLGGSSGDGARNIQLTIDGGYITAGYTNSNNGDVTGNHGEYDFWIVKLSSTGNMQWQKALGGTSFDSLFDIQITPEGGYIIAGNTSSVDGDVIGNHGGVGVDAWVVKLEGNAIPTSKVKANLCGATLTSLNQNINADYVAGYQQYRFEVTNGATVNTLEVNKYNFSLTKIPGITYNTTYGVRVAVKMGGTWGAYGVSCNVTTPAISVNTVPTTTIHPNFCGATLTSLDTKIPAVLVYGATKGRFEVTIAGGSPVVYEVAAYNFKLSQTGVAVLYNTSYAIRVAALVNGVWGNYGSSCTVTTPQAPGGRLKAKSFEVTAYPNPFETAFSLNIETPSKEEVTITVYDMMGKLVETHQVNHTEVANLQIGNNYAAGIYNVIVSQANEMQAIRLIRK